MTHTATHTPTRSPAAVLLQELVAIPSISRDEARIAAFLCAWLQQHGVSAIVRDNNVIATVTGNQPGPLLLLNSHLDTVGVAEGWSTPPWKPMLHGGNLYGLGSNDAKASVAAMAMATVQIARRGLARGTLLFVASCMEEVGRGGLEYLLESLPHIDAAIVGEPTQLQPATAQGGLLILKGTVLGKSAHAARAHLGVNALTIAARDLLVMDTFTLKRIHPLLGPSSAHITVLNGGDRHNVIPDRCEYTIDIRYTPAYTPEALLELLQTQLTATLRVHSKRLQPVETAADAPIVQALLKAAPTVQPFGSPTMSDWVHLKGIDAIKMGPGDSRRSHTPDEFVEISQVDAAVERYSQTAQIYLCAKAAQS